MKKLFKLYFIDLYIPFIYVKDFNYLTKWILKIMELNTLLQLKMN